MLDTKIEFYLTTFALLFHLWHHRTDDQESSEMLGMNERLGWLAMWNVSDYSKLVRDFSPFNLRLSCRLQAHFSHVPNFPIETKVNWTEYANFFLSHHCCWFSITCWKKNRFSLLHCWSIRFGFYCSILVGVSTKKKLANGIENSFKTTVTSGYKHWFVVVHCLFDFLWQWRAKVKEKRKKSHARKKNGTRA